MALHMLPQISRLLEAHAAFGTRVLGMLVLISPARVIFHTPSLFLPVKIKQYETSQIRLRCRTMIAVTIRASIAPDDGP